MFRKTVIDSLCAGDDARGGNEDGDEGLGKGRRSRERETEKGVLRVCAAGRTRMVKHVAYSQCNNAFDGALWFL